MKSLDLDLEFDLVLVTRLAENWGGNFSSWWRIHPIPR